MNTFLFLDMFAAKSIEIPTRSVKQRYSKKSQLKRSNSIKRVPVRVNEICEQFNRRASRTATNYFKKIINKFRDLY